MQDWKVRIVIVGAVVLIAIPIMASVGPENNARNAYQSERLMWPGINGPVSAIVRNPYGNIYVSGGFASVGNEPGSYFGKWDATLRSVTGSAMDGEPCSLTLDLSGNLYTSDSFPTKSGEGEGEGPLSWLTSESAALAAARSQYKLVLLLAGRNTCSNTVYMRDTVCESTDIKNYIRQHYIPWFSDVDTDTDWYAYAAGLGSFTLPLICRINPNDPGHYLDQSTSVQDSGAFYARLNQYALTVDVTGQGVVDINPGGGSYASGASVTLTPVPASSWHFDHWEGDLSGNASPADITMDGNKSVTAVFISAAGEGEGEGEGEAPTGSLAVTIEPADALSDGAKWRVDGGGWQDGGVTLSNLAVGQHELEFKDIPPETATGCFGLQKTWTTPAGQMVRISAGQTQAVTGTYVQSQKGLAAGIPANRVTSDLLLFSLASSVLLGYPRLKHVSGG